MRCLKIRFFVGATDWEWQIWRLWGRIVYLQGSYYGRWWYFWKWHRRISFRWATDDQS